MPSNDFTRCAEQSAKGCILASRCARWNAPQTEGRMYTFSEFDPVREEDEECYAFYPTGKRVRSADQGTGREVATHEDS